MPQTEAPPLREDAHGVIPYVGIADLSLYQLSADLFELLALAEAPDLDDDSRAAIDQQIGAYFAGQIRKVDGVAAAVRVCERNEAVEQAEADRHAGRAKSWKARKDRIKSAALRAMQAFGVRVLETPANTLRVQNNGGLAPLEISDAALLSLSAELLTQSATMSAAAWKIVFQALEVSSRFVGVHEMLRLALSKPEPSGAAIRASLKLGTQIEGAKLGERGQHLRVE